MSADASSDASADASSDAINDADLGDAKDQDLAQPAADGDLSFDLLAPLDAGAPPADVGPLTRYDQLGSGTKSDPFLLATAQQWQDLTQNSVAWDKHFQLVDDIDLGVLGGDTLPLGDSTTPFRGVLDGGQHVISGFQNLSGASFNGLIGHMDDPAAELKNVAVKNAQVQGGDPSGALVGMLVNGTVSNAASFGPSCSVTSSGYANHKGGLIGEVSVGGTVRDVFSTCRIDGRGTGIAGLIGHNDGSLQNAYYANTSAPISGTNRVAGLIGWHTATGLVQNAFTVADVAADTSYDDVALHIGTCSGTVVNSSFDSTRSLSNSGGGATTVNGSGIDTAIQPDYFFRETNQPLASWDFNATWLERPGDFPTLRWLRSY